MIGTFPGTRQLSCCNGLFIFVKSPEPFAAFPFINAYDKKLLPVTRTLTETIYKRAYTGDCVLNECENGVVNKERIWWVQAEAMVGFLNGYARCPEKTEYMEAVRKIWDYINGYVIDKREGSEWFWALDENEKRLVSGFRSYFHIRGIWSLVKTGYSYRS